MTSTVPYIGQAMLRREDDYLLRGQGHFIDDLPTPMGTLHLGFVLSPHAHARIVAIDTSPALALDGVVTVLTGDDLAKHVKPIVAEIEFPGYHPHGRDVIAREPVERLLAVRNLCARARCHALLILQDALRDQHLGVYAQKQSCSFPPRMASSKRSQDSQRMKPGSEEALPLRIPMHFLLT